MCFRRDPEACGGFCIFQCTKNASLLNFHFFRLSQMNSWSPLKSPQIWNNLLMLTTNFSLNGLPMVKLLVWKLIKKLFCSKQFFSFWSPTPSGRSGWDWETHSGLLEFSRVIWWSWRSKTGCWGQRRVFSWCQGWTGWTLLKVTAIFKIFTLSDICIQLICFWPLGLWWGDFSRLHED